MVRRCFSVILACGVCLVALSPAAASPESAAHGLVAHRAVYDLKLKNASQRSGIEGMTGRMVYEFTGSACAGFATNFRLVTRISTGEDSRLTDQQSKSFEDMAAKKFHFESKSFTDQQPDRDVSGDAKLLDNDGLKVSLTRPEGRELDLPQSRFPTAHMLEVIESAKSGRQFLEARVFDGSEDGDEALLTTTVIGKSQMPAKDDSEAKEAGAFSGQSYWPVTVAYFNEQAAGDPTPVYNMSFKLHENGLTRDLTLDYGDFSLTGTLTKLDVLDNPKEACPPR